MKKLIAIFIMLVSANFMFAQNTNPNGAKFKFVEDTHDFGTMKEGADAVYDFVFTNVGKEPLVINNCTASCGCTVPTWPHEPIMPGAKSKITVKFDTHGKNGGFNKSIFIQSNVVSDKDRYEIYIKGSVTPAPPVPGTNPTIEKH
jgi:Protein of unknown function (DUF1573)